MKLSYTKTQQDRFSSLERWAKEVIGRSVPGILNSVKKEALDIVKRLLENKICDNFKNYFEIHEHGMATRNNGHLVTLPKFKLELGKQSFKNSGAKLFNDPPLHFVVLIVLIKILENNFTRLKLAPDFFHIYSHIFTKIQIQIQKKKKGMNFKSLFQRSSIYYLSNKKSSSIIPTSVLEMWSGIEVRTAFSSHFRRNCGPDFRQNADNSAYIFDFKSTFQRPSN